MVKVSLWRKCLRPRNQSFKKILKGSLVLKTGQAIVCKQSPQTDWTTYNSGVIRKNILKILVMDREAWLLKCCTQDARKFGKLRSSHRTGKGQFSSQSQERQWQRLFKLLHNCAHLACYQSNGQHSHCEAFTVCEMRTSICTSWIQKTQRSQKSNCRHLLVHSKSKSVPEKHLLLLYWLCQRLWLCGSQQIVENSSRDRNTRPPYLPPEKAVCRWRNTS